jgi:SAM-dependent methyltransferase
MNHQEGVDVLIGLALEHKMWPRRQSLVYHFKDVFDGVDLKEKNVLDIGGGMGILSFYAAINGAKKTVCLEPESEGSTSGMINQFNLFEKSFRADLPIQHLPLTLQEYLLKYNDTFDIVILNNSINHLNEEAAIKLREDKKYYDYYVDMFSTVFKNMNKGGKLIITDCTNRNFFNDLGMQSPIMNSIEWHKHQSPETWCKLLKEVGFKNPSVNWSSINRLGEIGRVLFKNAISAYFTTSHFRLVMQKIMCC